MAFVEPGGFRQPQDHLQCRGLWIGDGHPFDRSNLAEDLVGSHKVFHGAAAVEAQRDRELEGIERTQAMT